MIYREYKSILSAKNGINIYRGCSHGCIYCDSRSLCYQINHDFTDIEIKLNAPVMLEHALKHKRKKCMIATGLNIQLWIYTLRMKRKVFRKSQPHKSNQSLMGLGVFLCWIVIAIWIAKSL